MWRQFLLAVAGAALVMGTEVNVKDPGMPPEVDEFAISPEEPPIPPLPGMLYPRESESREVTLICICAFMTKDSFLVS